ncbi:Hsp70 family protein [Myxococcus xanthus]|uniref:Molecular chaperone DnaK n=1 Tax=Myxococcus xanthus TaxID=34 RepID=A0AAE6G374_MYXXA|nr:Hsp70 family protein [Myxococcus xanthus]QDE70128.1 molecular chaperone DnaK [Myxococcus xanthus]QDE77407.1 molecular chaperone DnaK [Myxococcus xanthus]QDE98957.1 molecular chaperone DnaK [Myxococcus xanthus]QDF06623.1 molecular chaperone DnaK [Myxococcus xanthus]
MSTGSILGIDFGTTNTAAAFFDKAGKLRVVPVTDKSVTLPSVVWFHAADKAIVGHAARRQIIDDPRHTVFGAKRFLGRRFQSEYVTQHKDKYAFGLVEAEDGYTAVTMYGKQTSLTDVAHLIIKQILTLANHAAGTPFRECVLTVPAHASSRQRAAVRHAAEQAGLQVRAIVNEPTAAALYYANLRNPEQTVMVFDLGGGTFDATLLAVQNKVVKVLATGGDAFLGGANFDERIVEMLVDDFQQKHGIDLRGNKVVMQRLVFAAESAKMSLSQRDATVLRVPCIAQKDGGFIDFDYTLTRKRLEEMVFQLIERTASACDDVLERAKLKPDQVDELVLVGGQTRMPAIRQRFSHFKRLSSDKEVNPELGVAVGAAILGRNLARGITGLADVVPMPISIMVPGGAQHEVIPANTPVPATKSVTLELPMIPGPLSIALFEALDTTTVDRELLGTVRVELDWRTTHKGPTTLELRMGQDFILSAALVSPQGARHPLVISDMRAPKRSA